MKKALLLLLLLFLISHVHSQEGDLLKGLDQELNEILQATKAAGFSVAVVEKDKVIYAKGFGYRDYENKIPVDANTLFAIGSSSKAFTSGILGQLRQEDKLSFDDSPIEYIPELRFHNDDLNSHITIKDLMCHRTGLPRHDLSWYLFPTSNKDSLLQRVAYQEPFTGLREQWYYNNFMFLAQGVVAERVTGKSWEDNIRERFFEPLGMKRSNVSIDELEVSSNAALGYELKNDSVISKMDYYHISGMSPAGSINSSATEMANWVKTWIYQGQFEGQEILPASYVDEAMSSQMVIHSALPDAEFPDIHFANYGYGWMVSSYKGHYRVEHGGNIDGFSANVAFFPSDSLGIVVLVNQNGSAVPGIVRNTIADKVLNCKQTNWTKRYLERKEEAKKEMEEADAGDATGKIDNTRPSHVLLEYTGTYDHPGYGTFEITLENDSLFANFTLMKLYLKHYHYDVFDPYEVTDSGIDTSSSVGGGAMKFNFETNTSGDVALVKLKAEQTIDPIEFKHTPALIDIDADILESYVGEFQISGMEIKVYTKNDTTLFLFVTGQPEYELLATSKHKFSFKALEGFKVEFIESEDGLINEVMLIQPNGTFKATRKSN